MMKVLVAGGAGYIGSVTTEQLLERGDEVIVFDNLERGHRRGGDPRARPLGGGQRGGARNRAAPRGAPPPTRWSGNPWKSPKCISTTMSRAASTCWTP